MSVPEAPQGRNYRRRAVGVIVCLALFGVPVVSLCVDQTAFEVAPIMRLISSISGLACTLFGLFITALNAHLAFLRPLLYRRRHGSYEGMRNISGFPAIGTFVVVIGCFLAIGHRPTAVLGLVVLTLDVGGLPWFLIATWHDRGLWDE